MYTLTLGATRWAPRLARRWVAATAARCGLSRRVCEDAELLVGELAANALEHAGGPSIVVQVRVSVDRLWVAVADQSPVRPVIREIVPTDRRGRGLRLVAQAASRWGSEQVCGGKRVWFEIYDT